MAPVVGDILQIIDRQVFSSEQILNVYFYRVVTLEPAATYLDIRQAFLNVVMPAVRAFQHVNLVHNGIIIKNLTNGLDLDEGPINLAGLGTAGEALPSLVALSFRLVRSTLLTRHGSKRIGGLAESQTSGNAFVGAQANLDAAAAAFAGDITVTGTVDHDVVLEPVIIGRHLSGSPNAGELDLTRINPVQAAQFIRVSSQVSRRAGRGM